MENIILIETGNETTIVGDKKTAKKKYKCPYCEARIERAKLHIHIQNEHEELIPAGYTALRVAFNTINKKTEGHCIICKGVTDWNEDKARYERLCNNPACHEAYKKMVAERTKRIYGTDRLQTDPKYADYVQRKALEGRKMSGKYKFTDGGEVSYMGSYERKFLEFMDTVIHAESEDILAPGPSIQYEFQGATHIYIPDFFYVPYNLIVEIKDGGANKNMHPKRLGEEEERIKAKEKAVANQKMFNYVRVTDNDFSQLMTVMAVLKYQLVFPAHSGEQVIRVNESSDILNENILINAKDIYYNKDKFDSGEINLCFITGHSGSGKSTMARNMMKNNGIESYCMDDLWFVADRFTINDLKRYGDLIYSFFVGPGKDLYVSQDDINDNEISEYEDKLYPRFVEYAMNYADSHCDKKFAVEGLFLYCDRWFKPEDFKDYAFYIKGTSMIISFIRSTKRGLERSDTGMIDRAKFYFSTMTNGEIWRNRLIDEKMIKKFYDYFSKRVSTNESVAVNENVVFNAKDIYYNKDKFDSGEINLCFITGVSGSGKSTMANYMKNSKQKTPIEVVSLDDIMCAKDNYNEEQLKKCGDLMYSFFTGPGKDLYITYDQLKSGDCSDRYKDLFRIFVDYSKQYARSHKDRKYIVEGVWLFYDNDFSPEEFKDYAFYIKGTSALVSHIRAAKRGSADADTKMEKITGFIKYMTNKKIWKFGLLREKQLRRFYDYFSKLVSTNESALLESSSAMNKLYKCKTPEDLLKFMGSINYGWIDLSGKIQGTGEDDDEDDFYKEYRLQSPEQLIKSKVGVCWDQVELERSWFGSSSNYSGRFKVIYIIIDDGENYPTHTFLVYADLGENTKVKWFEHSWGQYKGIHEYNSISQCLSDVVRKHCNQNKSHNPVYVYDMSKPRYGCNCQSFMNHACKGKKIDPSSVKFEDLFKVSSIKESNNISEDMSGTIGAALPPSALAPTPMPYESNPDNYYVVQYPKDEKLSYAITKDPTQFSMISVDPTDRGSFKVDKTNKQKIYNKQLKFKVKGTSENYLTYRIKDKAAGKALYDTLLKVAESTGEIYDSSIKSNYIYETLTDGCVIQDPDQMMFDSRFELVDNSKEKEKKGLTQIYNWLKGGNLDKLEEQVDDLIGYTTSNDDIYNVLPDENEITDISQLNDWKYRYYLMPKGQREVSDTMSIQKYSKDNLTRYNDLYSKLVQNRGSDASIGEATVTTDILGKAEDDCTYLNNDSYLNSLEKVKTAEANGNVIIMVLDSETNYLDYTTDEINMLKEKWVKFEALPQKYRDLSNHTAMSIFGIDNITLYEKAINSYIARQTKEWNQEQKLYPEDECAVPYYIPSNKVLKTNPEGIFNENQCINTRKYVNTLQLLQCSLKSSKTDAQRQAIKEEIISYGWNPEIPCTESALQMTYARHIYPNIEIVNTKSYLEAVEERNYSNGYSYGYLKDKIVPIFITLVRGELIRSKVIRMATNSTWSHATLALDSSLDALYTYDRYGFDVESRARYIAEHPNMLIKTFALFITSEQRSTIAKAVDWYVRHKGDTKYAYANLINILNSKPTHRGNFSDKTMMVCSQFVYTMLSLVNFSMTQQKDPSIVTPDNIDKLSNDSRLYVVYEGPVNKYNRFKVDKICDKLLTTLPLDQYGITESSNLIANSGIDRLIEVANIILKNE